VALFFLTEHKKIFEFCWEKKENFLQFGGCYTPSISLPPPHDRASPAVIFFFVLKNKKELKR
jgi:hypothetical protein